MKVIVSPAARDYIKSEIAYLKLRSPRAALRLSEDLKRVKRDLVHFSQMRHFTEELPIPGVRRFVMGAYLIDYEIRGGDILIFCIRHGRERPPAIPLDDDFDFEQS
ncbi:plasmid stabilization system protein ParE [Ochrobactrum daejeonense]|uniref:Plasmid stabilization system protein ParE n=1 Tax=Brucella daejeonensis TaxID=659015 RepID=A0A7W9B2B9_9HYPH|nr:type II toxin-antitoxin system RelE/ParE family toxin [Brucella daejeonensis]MBB5704539.1 plasmid stabilization system protein ParE [Brucella daejeonensis]NKB78673.1 type II toxin-antitoxin system RelE/ParE family toxin [Brucella daejeonensis]